ncbi:DUF2846 domain-containing protein [Lysobacter enzymogenes]|uniref:DUF2846 domain-containing protein n=1 Tax=Lysobacter enzymogenes TaxID=69 RepID=UPI00089AC730|nr:DUF2846 domain-containing protein [Lysobacter enzymogenes]SDW17261.1 hypothetical protein SAMN05421681_101311 [Lysobacter enzymogenes]
MKHTLRAAAFAAVLLAAGGAQAQMPMVINDAVSAAVNSQRSAPLKLAPPDAGKALVVFYRDVPFWGNRQIFEVREGDASLASLRFGQYAVRTIEPGEHRFVLAEGGDGSALSLQAEAGHTYYFEGVLEKVERSKRQRLNRVEADRFERTSFKLAPSEPGLAGLGPADPDPFQ